MKGVNRQKKLIEKLNFLASVRSCTIREFAMAVATIVSACPAYKYGWLFTKRFEYARYRALEKFRGNYDMVMPVPASVHGDIDWWYKNFLSEMFSNRASYGTVNSVRSALSLLLSPTIGNDFRIKRFLKGVQNWRPITPKYNATWNPAVVLRYLEQLMPNHTLSLQVLTYKLVTLLALVSAHRLRLLRVKQPVLILPRFEENQAVCVVNALEIYLQKTCQLRGSCTKLFIQLKKPHREVSSQTLSRWIKTTLTDSGVDTKYSRHAATSSACRAGVSIDIIRTTAGWSTGSNSFFKFYNRPLFNRNCFSQTVLNST
nr:unnamed protein product [Callosobruchus chinensis]